MHGARGVFQSSNLILALAVVAILGLIALAGCSDSSNPTNPGGGTGSTSSFTGIFSGGSASGKLNLTVNTTSLAGRGIIKRAGRGIVTATGTADFGASNVNLIGNYDTATNQFAVAGGGYSFYGNYETSTFGKANINGFWSGPGNRGGDFVCYLGNNTNVSVYCGTYHSNSSSSDSTGNWTFGVVDTLLAGYSFGDSASTGQGIVFVGKVSASGNPRVITINYTPTEYDLLAPGAIDTTGVDAVTGTFSFTDNVGGGGTVTGTYTGALCP